MRHATEVGSRASLVILEYAYCVFSGLLPLRAGELRLGRAAVDITPPRGVPMGGYFEIRLNSGVHDPLFAKAVVLEEDGDRAAIVACDLESIPREFVATARNLIESATGIRGDHVMISATHTHTGPEMSHFFIDLVQGAPRQAAEAYRSALPQKIRDAVRLAAADLKPARLWASIGEENSLSFNRRFVMKDGTVGWNPGKLNPKIVRPAGPVDPRVSVVYADLQDARPLATLVNYALHLDTVGGTDFSKDYPFTLANLLEAVKGPEMLTVFTIGTAGNINHLDVSIPDPQHGSEEAARIGTVLAGSVLKTYKRLSRVEGALKVRRTIVKLPLQELESGELERARRLSTDTITGKLKNTPFLDLVHAFKVLNVAEYQGKPIDAEVLVIAVGDDLAWVGLPGEVFVELGMAIKDSSPFQYTIIHELANDSIDYVPNLKAFAEGNYEPTTARCKPGCGEMLVDAATRLLIEAHRGDQAN